MGLSPDAFWALSLAEWRWLVEAGPAPDAALRRPELTALVNQFPDETP